VARILDIAPQFDRARSDAGGSHFVSYHDAFRAGAAALGHDLGIVTQVGAGGSDPAAAGVLDVLPAWPSGRKVSLDWEPALAALDQLIADERERMASSQPVVVMRFEGKLQDYPGIVRLAERHPDVWFVWNLFALPPGSVPAPIDVNRRGRPIVGGGMSGGGSWDMRAVSAPPNLTVLADTWQRHASARQLGIPSSGVWPLHSNLATLDETTSVAQSERRLDDGRASRVLILLAGWQSDTAVRAAVLGAVRSLHRLDIGVRPEFTLAGAPGADRPHLRWLDRLERSSVAVHRGTGSLDDYAARIREHDLVWLPNGRMYRTKSSGKALDALVTGTPVLAPAGSYAAAQLARWVPWGLDYTSPAELLGMLGSLPDILPTVVEELNRRLGEIRTEYSVSTTIQRIVRLAGPSVERAEPAGPDLLRDRPRH
jgi:hypothetical protein